MVTNHETSKEINTLHETIEIKTRQIIRLRDSLEKCAARLVVARNLLLLEGVPFDDPNINDFDTVITSTKSLLYPNAEAS